MKRFVEGEDRTQVTLLPECLDDYIEANNPVRVIDVFVDGLDLGALGFAGVEPSATGRPAYHPATLLRICIYDRPSCLTPSTLWRLHFETGHWHGDFPVDRMTGSGRVLEAASGCFVAARHETAGVKRRAASGEVDRLERVAMQSSA